MKTCSRCSGRFLESDMREAGSHGPWLCMDVRACKARLAAMEPAVVTSKNVGWCDRCHVYGWVLRVEGGPCSICVSCLQVPILCHMVPEKVAE